MSERIVIGTCKCGGYGQCYDDKAEKALGRCHDELDAHKDVSRQDHYTAHAIQPIEYIVGNGLDFLAGNVVKYVTRYSHKNGVEDLKKARVYLDWLIEREESGKITAHR